MIGQFTGTILDNRYRLLRQLASGATSFVYDAEDLQLERFVAVKLLRPELAAAASQAFQHEARVGAALLHPGLVKVYSTGQDGDKSYIVMERIQGDPLDITAAPNLDRDLDIAEQVAGTLAFLHSTGIVHGAINPANILLDGNGHARLIDFGNVHSLEPGEMVSADLGGAEAPYAAPETLADPPRFSPAADIYGLSATLSALLAGHPPLRDTATTRPIATGAAIPPSVAALVQKGMASDPATRFASAEALRDAIQQLRRQFKAQTAAVIPEALPGATPAPPVAAPLAAQSLPVIQRRPVFLVPAALLALLVIGALFVFRLIAGEHSEVASAAPRTPAVRLTAAPTQPHATATTVQQVTVPDLKGLTLADAQAALTGRGLVFVEAPGAYSDSVPESVVLGQEPAGGAQLAANSPITVTASLGPQPQPTQPAPTATVAPAEQPAPPAANPPAPPADNNGPGNSGDKGKGKDKGNPGKGKK